MGKKFKLLFMLLTVTTLLSCSRHDKENIATQSGKIETTFNRVSTDNLEEYRINKVAFLTFDDGPSKNTEKILDILKKENVQATFFVNGNNSEFAVNMYKRMVNEGHAIGNHTYSHTYEDVYTSKYAFIEDIKKLDSLIFTETGYRINLLRFPGGSNNTINRRYSNSRDNSFMECLSNEVESMGYRYFDWTVDSTDASKVKQKEGVIVKNTLNEALKQKYPIILFHDAPAKTTTVEALSGIIKKLKESGYKIKPLSYDVPVESSFLKGINGEILK
ncbi:MAG: polysaccharide deacetylase family protein [Clostridium sp.]